MKKFVAAGLVLAGIGMSGLSVVRSDEKHDHMKPYVGSSEFERMKGLAGHWEGASAEGDMGKVTVDYKVTSGGSAILETISAGTPHEMVSVYHDQSGKLEMTHYCMLGNQPEMELKKASANEYDFSLAKGGSINADKDAHMHSLDIAFTDANDIVETWSMYENGKQVHSTVFKLARAQ